MGKKIKNGCIEIGDTHMYYVSFGTGSKNMVILPGLSDGLSTVKGKGLILSAPYRKFMNDYTIYMFSRKNDMPEGYSIEDMADDQVEVLKKLGINKTSILGVSQGGMIAQCIAIFHPDIVERLVLAVTAPSANQVVKEAVSAWIELVEKNDHTGLMVDTAEKMYSEAYLSKNRKLFPILAKFTKPKSYDRFLKNANAILKFDVTNELSRISAPTLIIAGSDDKTVGNDAAVELHRNITGSNLHIYEGLGHGAFEEAKDFYDRVFA